MPAIDEYVIRRALRRSARRPPKHAVEQAYPKGCNSGHSWHQEALSTHTSRLDVAYRLQLRPEVFRCLAEMRLAVMSRA